MNKWNILDIMLNQIRIEQKKQIGSKPMLGGYIFFHYPLVLLIRQFVIH
jgi:hypothetical protein